MNNDHYITDRAGYWPPDRIPVDKPFDDDDLDEISTLEKILNKLEYIEP